MRRLRRLRGSPALRRMVQETRVCRDDLIYPLFAVPGSGVRREISSMPGVFHFSIDQLVEEGKAVAALGIPAVILFGIPEGKDEMGSAAYARDGIVPRAVEALKRWAPELVVIADVCLCEYTSHGHCGVIRDGEVDNDATLELLAKASLAYAEAGADMVAPSDMMDGRVGAIRQALDAGGHAVLPIMAYSAKYASAFYGPFREAAQSAPQFGDRRSYQMSPANVREAHQEVLLDVAEGADIVMVKPALAYLDVVRMVRESVSLPVAAYNVSGEYAMVKAAARAGWIDEERTVMEILVGIKRAGADLILTYHAKDAVRWLLHPYE